MTRKLFTSDLHFSHKNICKYTDRHKFTSQDLHNEWLIETLNKNIERGDLLYILGDVSFDNDVMQTAKLLKAINGQKIIIKGNHDKTKELKELADLNIIQAWYHYHEIKLNKVYTCLFHFPIMHWNRASHGSYHLHGHLHGNTSGVSGRLIDVGIDSAYNTFGEYRVFTEEDLHSILGSIDIKKHHI